MEIIERCRENTNLIVDCEGDSDPYSNWRNWRKSQFWYEVDGLRRIPDYRSPSSYPWEKQEKEGDRKGLYFLIVRDKSWSKLSDKQRLRRCNRQCSMKSKSTPYSQCVWEGVDAQPPPLCSSVEVLRVRLEMHQCFEKGISLHCMFKSEANKQELCFQSDEPYMFFVNRCQRESRVVSYSHVFPKLEVEPLSCKWVKPTTLEGDRQYLEFFPKLIQAVEYGETKEIVLAKAIVLARKLFLKILYFQIDVAVQDCMELKENEEGMKQRYDIYYFTVSEIVLNGKDLKSVLDNIRDGFTGLPYDLTEFGSTDAWEGVIADIVDHIVHHLRSERECGLYKDWVFDKVDNHVAEFVYETLINSQLGLHCHLYVDFLRKKMRVAQDLGLITKV